MYMKYSVLLHTAVLHVHCHLFFIFHYTHLYFMYIVTSFSYFTTELYFMYIVASFLCFTTHSCTSCTLSPLFYVLLHTAVLHAQCHLLFYEKRGDNVHEVQLCVVKHKKEATMYMKYSSVVKYEKEVTMYMKYSCV
jgi:hypothetical protein